MKYDCTKAKDFLHEAARVDKYCTDHYGSEGCIDNCPLEKFDEADGRLSCIRKVSIADLRWLTTSDSEFDAMSSRLQEWSDSHPERRELTEDEICILKAFKALGYKYIAADGDGDVYAYIKSPNKHDTDGYVEWFGEDGESGEYICSKFQFFNGVLSLTDEKPAKIEELLKGVEE